MKPAISVIIPCFNHGIYLDDAYYSVNSQTDINVFELLIVNDGSTDLNTLAKLSELEKRGVKVIHQSNKGLGSARNTGIQAASGKYILPLDSDNRLVMSVFKEALAIMEMNEEIDVVYTDCEYFEKMNARFVVGDFNFEKLVAQNYIDACALIRKSTLDRLGLYDEQMPVMGHEDWELWIRIYLNKGVFRYLNKIGYQYRVRNDSMIRTGTARNHELNQEYIFRKYSKELIASYVYLAAEKEKFDFVKWYLKNSRWKSVMKLLFGKSVP